MKFDKDSVAVITGAGAGIGREIAELLAERGCKLAISDVNAVDLAATKKALEEKGSEVFAQEVDVSSRVQMNTFASQTFARFRRVDAVFNNAGVSVQQTALETSYKDFQWVMDVNFWGTVYGTRAFLPLMLDRDQGCIVNVSSMLGLVGAAMNSAYSASKFAVRGYTESLRMELAAIKSPVTVSCVFPGPVNTDIAKNSRFYISSKGDTDYSSMAENFSKNARTTARDAAKIIVQDVEKAKPRILVGSDVKKIDWVQRLMPGKYDNIVFPELSGSKAS